MLFNIYHGPISCLDQIFDFSKKNFHFFIFMHNSLRATSKSSLVSSFLKQKTFFSSNFKKFSRSRMMNPKAFLIWNRQWRTSFHYHFELQSDISKNNRLARIGYKKGTSFLRRLNEPPKKAGALFISYPIKTRIFLNIAPELKMIMKTCSLLSIPNEKCFRIHHTTSRKFSKIG